MKYITVLIKADKRYEMLDEAGWITEDIEEVIKFETVEQAKKYIEDSTDGSELTKIITIEEIEND